jgi:hypothetical protein
MNNLKKSDINCIFYKNKRKYIITISLLVLLSIALLLFGFLWMISPSEYIYWRLPNEYFVFVVGALSCISSIVLFLTAFLSINNKDFFIRINEEGLFAGTLLYKNKLIKWSDIKSVQILEKNNNKYIKVDVININNYNEKGIRKLLFFINLKQNNTPFLLHTNALNGEVNEIKNAIEKALNVYGNKKRK